MHRFRAWAASAALLVAWHADGLRAGEPGRPSGVPTTQESTPWYKRMFGKSDTKPQPVPQPAPVPAPKERPADVAARTLLQEQQEYNRQLEVISAIKIKAAQAGDEDALQRADDLEREATEVYKRRIAHLPVARLKALPEEMLDRQLGTGVATNPLEAGSVPGKTASANLGTKGGDR